ncbi:MAG TPA: hypothetical protein VIV60_29665 [Polyangiaceae bacterium]
MAERRHLTVISNTGNTDVVPGRSASNWLILSTVLAVALWLPLGMLGLWMSRLASYALDRLAPHSGVGMGLMEVIKPGLALLPILGSFAASAYVGGVVVAKFGPVRNGARDAAVGALSGVVVVSLAAVEGALRPWLLGVIAYVTLITLGMASAFLGGRRGRNWRNAANLTRLD